MLLVDLNARLPDRTSLIVGDEITQNASKRISQKQQIAKRAISFGRSPLTVTLTMTRAVSCPTVILPVILTDQTLRILLTLTLTLTPQPNLNLRFRQQTPNPNLTQVAGLGEKLKRK